MCAQPPGRPLLPLFAPPASPPFSRVAALLLLAAAAVLATGPARAGLFDDEEARRAILDLRSRIQATDDAGKARNAELAQTSAQLLEQMQQLRRSLLDLNTQLQAQRDDNAKLRGTQEQLTRDLADLQRRLKDASQNVDERLRKLEPLTVSVDGKDFSVDPDEKRAHDAAMAPLRTGDFDQAASLLAAFVKRYPAGAYTEAARFWLGNALYGQKNYKDAITVFRAVVTAAPEHPRAAEALLALANCQVEMKDVKAARKTFDELLKTYPKSEAAVAGKERLGTLKG
jgi:tol-pal system protein YbgF